MLLADTRIVGKVTVFWVMAWLCCPLRKLTAAAAKSLQLCLTRCDPTDGSPPGSPVPGILQARTLEWVAISFSNAWKWKVKVKLLSKCPTLHDPMDYSLPSSSVHGIFQARVPEWVAIALIASDIRSDSWIFTNWTHPGSQPSCTLFISCGDHHLKWINMVLHFFFSNYICEIHTYYCPCRK